MQCALSYFSGFAFVVLIIMNFPKSLSFTRRVAISTPPRILWSCQSYSSSISSLRSESEKPMTGARISAAVVQDMSSSNSSGSTKGELPLSPPKGTRDFYPEDHRLKNWLFGIWRDTAKRYSFEEYDAPVVENVDLYIRKAGEEVTQQLYDFEDKGGRHLSLRPEMTPSLARMVLAKKNTLPFPLKWFSIPQCWRYERMTRGRRREHYQWNMDIFGVQGIEAEAELLSSIIFSFQQMGISYRDVGIKINSRKLLNDLMAKVGVPKDKWVATCVLVDKLDKVELLALTKDIEQLGLSMSMMEELVSLLTIKTIDEYSSQLGENAEGVQDIRKLLYLLEQYGVKDWVEFDPSVVRGLAYYTGVVFEGFDRSRELRAICGGGRYDKLLESFGGEAVPAVGFGFGDAVIVELLKMKKLLPDFQMGRVDFLAYAMKESLRGKLLQHAQALRAQGYSVDIVLDERKPKWVFQRADKMGAGHVIIFGEDEDALNEVTIKNMNTGQQERCKYSNIISYLSSVTSQCS